METTLHRDLKSLYCADPAGREVRVDGFRIDALAGRRLIEIQCGSLGAIRDKVRRLLDSHRVHVVKPLASRKFLVTRGRAGGPVASARYSPLRETMHHVFADLVHFVNVFPHRRLTLEVLLTEQEEHRVPARGRRRRSRGYRVEDRLLRQVCGRRLLRTAGDLLALLPDGLPVPFATDDVAREAAIPRWLAQKMAYCLRVTGAVAAVGKRGNAILYAATPEAAVPKSARAA